MIGSDQLNLSRGKLHKAALWMSSVNYNVCLPSKYSVLIIQMPGRSVCYETEINKIKFQIKRNANTYYLVISQCTYLAVLTFLTCEFRLITSKRRHQPTLSEATDCQAMLFLKESMTRILTIEIYSY